MYVCDCHEMKLRDGRIAKRGEPVPEALEWSEPVRRSNVAMGYIKEVDDAPAQVTLDDILGPDTGESKGRKRRKRG